MSVSGSQFVALQWCNTGLCLSKRAVERKWLTVYDSIFAVKLTRSIIYLLGMYLKKSKTIKF